MGTVATKPTGRNEMETYAEVTQFIRQRDEMDIDGVKPMTADQFCSYWTSGGEEGRSQLSYMEEHFYEYEAQYGSECAIFGDAGPGQGLMVREMRAEIAKIRGRLEQFR
jgi:hypothetical protein